MDYLTFPAISSLPHRFILRQPCIDTATDRAEAVGRLLPCHLGHAAAMGFDRFLGAEQVHGVGIGLATAGGPQVHQGVDALISNDPRLLLAIYVADCAAVWIHDQRRGAVGLAHSGKKGSEGGIVALTMAAMRDHFGSRVEDMVVQVSPCIRPPTYEMDGAGLIREQCLAAGLPPGCYHDCGLCTALDLERFYSYRVELGKTGRMLAMAAATCAI
jgi:polyphenol oxidase